MKTICLYIHIHQPFLLKKFYFSEIGNGQRYYNEELNLKILREDVLNFYLPINRLLLELICNENKKLNINFCLSGIVLEQFEKHTPEVILSLRQLSETGCVEFVGETYSNSMAERKSRKEFSRQVKNHSEKINALFGKKPSIFRHPPMTYTDAIGEILCEIGYETVILDRIDGIYKRKNLNLVNKYPINSTLKLLVNKTELREDISNRSLDHNWNEDLLNAEKYIRSLKSFPEEELLDLSLDFGILRNMDKSGLGIQKFIKEFIGKALNLGIQFSKPCHLDHLHFLENPLVFSSILPYELNSRKEIVKFLGNDMQQEAFFELYDLEDQILACSDSSLERDWLNLQSSDHFYFMCTYHLSPGYKACSFNPYESPFHAFINYMNVLSDLRCRAQTLRNQQSCTTEN